MFVYTHTHTHTHTSTRTHARAHTHTMCDIVCVCVCVCVCMYTNYIHSSPVSSSRTEPDHTENTPTSVPFVGTCSSVAVSMIAGRDVATSNGTVAVVTVAVAAALSHSSDDSTHPKPTRPAETWNLSTDISIGVVLITSFLGGGVNEAETNRAPHAPPLRLQPRPAQRHLV